MGIMAIASKIQPSQLAEEQRNVPRLWKQLGRATETSHGSPTDSDVEEAEEKMLVLKKAYPHPLLPGMLEKFPAIIEPTQWWPKIQPMKFRAGSGSNRWSKELEEKLKGALRVLKALATAGPLSAGTAAISSRLMGSPTLGPASAFVSIVGGVLAATTNTLEHGASGDGVIGIIEINYG
ncbi:probable F-box protein At4g22030 [Zingiber officinale]|uniref:probable F-box protein At4g22030 n=1 Tax=Zingiber officinale TaxID=94328 RepID=UPI001C4CE1BF|nr:probable F-box protein At4g22030 [Zingiber officinale]